VSFGFVVIVAFAGLGVDALGVFGCVWLVGVVVWMLFCIVLGLVV